jgi:hypothetical protein
MDERGLALVDAILAGDDPLYDPGAYPDEETAVLGRLCEDFDQWRAARRRIISLQHPHGAAQREVAVAAGQRLTLP